MPPKRKAPAKSTAADSTTTEEQPTAKRLKTDPKMESKEQSQQSTVEGGDNSVELSPKGKRFNLKIVSWNVNGVRALVKKDNALEYFRRTEPCDILCLQETKCNKTNFPAQLKSLSQFPHQYFASSDKEGYAGVALLSRVKPFSVQYGLGNKKHDGEGRVITAFYDNFILVNAYTPNAGQGLVRLDYRISEWDKDFRNYLKELDSQKPVILTGDLNVSHKEIDIENPKSNVKNAGFTPEERASFGTLLEAGFIDSFRQLYPDRAKAYTFWSYKRAARANNVGWRLDYFVLSNRLREVLCDNQIRSQVMGSDHCPIVLYLGL